MDEQSMPCACSIAGSDPSGGAGIQADIKTFAALGVWGLTVITGITSQNPKEVSGLWTCPPDAVEAQITTLLGEYTIGACKTGMLGSPGVIRAIADILPDEIPLVVDPVIISSSGYRLLPKNGVETLVRILIPRAAVVTPNLEEAAILAGMPAITSLAGMHEAGQRILALGPEYVVVKGGHLGGEDAVDLLLGDGKEWVFEGPRYPYEVHGSGCCYAAALTSFLARDIPVPGACTRAKEFIDRALRSAARSRSGCAMVQPAWNIHIHKG
jgi:hydroxymethylpyrimidine/phosphomethylpyrimidine kinase